MQRASNYTKISTRIIPQKSSKINAQQKHKIMLDMARSAPRIFGKLHARKEYITMTHAKRLANQLTEETVLGEWFHPMDRALDKVRFSEKLFASLPMREFILFGCLRQVQAVSTLREMIQNLFHVDGQAVKPQWHAQP